MRKSQWIATGATALLLAGCSASVSVGGGDDRQAQVEEFVRDLIVKDLADQGVDITVTKTDCTDIPEDDGQETIDCRLTIDESTETVPVTAEITIDGDSVTGNAETSAGLLTVQAGIDYAQGLVDQVVEEVSVTACDLSDAITVVEPGDKYTCTTDSDETVTITIQPDGTGVLTVE